MTATEIETMEAYLEYEKAESVERTREELEPSDAELKFRAMTGVWPSELEFALQPSLDTNLTQTRQV
jgi:hypothetical protein